MSQEHQELFNGGEAEQLVEKLIQVYNGFMTGNREDSFYSDQFFKE